MLGVSPRANCSWRPPSHRADDDEPGMDPDADRQADALLRSRRVLRVPMASTIPSPSDGPLGVIFMGLGIAKIDEQPIAEILRDMPLKALDDLGTGGLIGPHHLPQVFRVELTGEHGRVHQVTEQDGELAAFGVKGLGGAGGGAAEWAGTSVT